MFERFTDRARRVVVLAQEEARLLSHNYIGTEHILLGLIHEGEGVAAEVLRTLGIGLDAVRDRVRSAIGEGSQAPSGHIPFTPRAKKVLELSLREALQLGHNYIGTEHILLGLIREGQGVAAEVLVALGADLNVVRQQVIRVLRGVPGPAPGSELDDPLPRPAGRLERGAISGALRRVTAVEARVASVEERIGTGPEDAGLDAQITRLGRERQAAVDAQEYERAAALRDEERELIGRRTAMRQEWAAAHPSLPALAEIVRELRAEVDRLASLVAGGAPASAAADAAPAASADAAPAGAEDPGPAGEAGAA